MEGFLIILLIVSLCIVIGILLLFRPLKTKTTNQEPTTFNLNLDPLHKAIESIPYKVLQSITSKNNNHKGDLGELVSFIKLGATYDRVIPLANIVDFLAIKLPTDTTEGSIDFIDAKTGKATLSKEQKAVKKLIEDKKVNFIKLRINIDTGLDDGDNQS